MNACICNHSLDCVDQSLMNVKWMTLSTPLPGDIFENYCRDDDLATFGRFCYGITVILTFPIECFVTREVSINHIHFLVSRDSWLISQTPVTCMLMNDRSCNFLLWLQKVNVFNNDVLMDSKKYIEFCCQLDGLSKHSSFNLWHAWLKHITGYIGQKVVTKSNLSTFPSFLLSHWKQWQQIKEIVYIV